MSGVAESALRSLDASSSASAGSSGSTGGISFAGRAAPDLLTLAVVGLLLVVLLRR